MASSGLSEKQASILEFFREYTAERQLPPTIREVATRLGIGTARGAQGHLRSLVTMGFLSHTPRTSRAYRLVPQVAETDEAQENPPDAFAVNDSRPPRRERERTRIPIVGQVPGGSPSAQEAEDLGNLELPIRVSDEAFAVRVTGDSMQDAHILEGDFAIGDPAVEPIDRSVVIALIGGAYTLKTLRRTEKAWWLEPANERYPPIMPDLDGDRVEAPVVALFRPQIHKRPRAVPWS